MNWLNPTSIKGFQKYKNWHFKTLFEGGAKWKPYLKDFNGPEPPFPLKKGCDFGKTCTSDFVSLFPWNTLFAKALNYCLELNFCRLHSPKSMTPVAWISYLLFQLCEPFQWKSLEDLWQANIESDKWLRISSLRHKPLTKSGTRSGSSHF